RLRGSVGTDPCGALVPAFVERDGRCGNPERVARRETEDRILRNGPQRVPHRFPSQGVRLFGDARGGQECRCKGEEVQVTVMGTCEEDPQLLRAPSSTPL